MRRQLVRSEIEHQRFLRCNEAKLAHLALRKDEEIKRLECVIEELAILNGAERKAPRSENIPFWCFRKPDFESCVSHQRRQIEYYEKRIGEIHTRERRLEAEVQNSAKDLQRWLQYYIRAPLTPMIGTNQAVRRALYNRSAAGRHPRDGPLNNIGEWIAFAVATMNIPLILMETNAIEAHVVLAFKHAQSRQLPGDVLAIVSGYVVDACKRTRAEFKRISVDASPEETKQRRVAAQYDRPWNECGRRMYEINWKPRY